MPYRLPQPSSRLQHPVALAALLSGLSMFGPFSIDAFFPAFHAITADLQASPWQMQQSISLYLVGYACMALVHGPLSDRYGRRRIILAGVVAYALASLGCAVSDSIETLLLFRFLQGCCTGAGMIVGRALVRDLYQGPDAQRVMAMTSMFFGIAPVIAPIIGALVFKAAGWHAVFLFLVAYGLLLWLLCLRLLPETHPHHARSSVHPQALLKNYWAMHRDLRFMMLVLATGGNFGGQFLYISSAPSYIERFLGLGSMGYAWFFVPMVIGMVTGSMLASRLARQMPPERSASFGYWVMAAATLLNLLYNALDSTPAVPWAIVPNLLYAMGVALAFPPLNLLMLDRYPLNRGAASSVQAFVWGLTTALIAGIGASLVLASARHLAVGSALLFVLGWLAWRGYLRRREVLPA